MLKTIDFPALCEHLDALVAAKEVLKGRLEQKVVSTQEALDRVASGRKSRNDIRAMLGFDVVSSPKALVPSAEIVPSGSGFSKEGASNTVFPTVKAAAASVAEGACISLEPSVAISFYSASKTVLSWCRAFASSGLQERASGLHDCASKILTAENIGVPVRDRKASSMRSDKNFVREHLKIVKDCIKIIQETPGCRHDVSRSANIAHDRYVDLFINLK